MMEIQKSPQTVFEDDTYLVSYPKSGNTWMRFLIGTLYFGMNIDWLNIDKFPDCYRPEEMLLSVPSPRLLKSHEPYDDRYQKVIYVVRDVRDVCISYYYHHLRHGEGLERLHFDDFFQYFISGEVWPGLWDRHVSSWVEHRDNVKEGLLLIRYEDLKRNIYGEVEKIAAFLNLKRTDEEIKKAVEWSSFTNMRALEQQQWTDSNSDIPFVRQGQTNTWKSLLTEEQKKEIKVHFGEILGRLGYLDKEQEE
jgi:hypothetical protein